MSRLVTFALVVAFLVIVASNGLANELEPHPVLEVGEWNQDWQDLQVTIRNPGTSTEIGFLIIWYSYSGLVGAWGLELELAGSTEETLNFNLNGEVTIGLGVYTNKPGSITDAPEPVARVVKRLDDERTDPEDEDED
jgi:hypothetical protein